MGKGKFAFFALIQTNLPVWSLFCMCLQKNHCKALLKCFACFIKAAPFKRDKKEADFEFPAGMLLMRFVNVTAMPLRCAIECLNLSV